uniref:Uncharacterized protein n=1 Tax=Rhizophora mucronata TaxID=61149 RepID=A0A2P2QFB1_RHIMU
MLHQIWRVSNFRFPHSHQMRKTAQW